MELTVQWSRVIAGVGESSPSHSALMGLCLDAFCSVSKDSGLWRVASAGLPSFHQQPAVTLGSKWGGGALEGSAQVAIEVCDPFLFKVRKLAHGGRPRIGGHYMTIGLQAVAALGTRGPEFPLLQTFQEKVERGSWVLNPLII